MHETLALPHSRTEIEDPGFHQSWYPLALARDLAADQVIGIDFLGTRVILYRDAAGKPVVQSAYCPHLGADLSVGKMVEGRIRCAFHHWSFAADGACAHIPTGDKIPREARLFTYPSAESWGLIWAFNGETPLFAPPSLPDAEESALLFEANLYGPRPLDPWIAVTNGVDFQHLRTLHGLPVVPPEMVEIGAYGLEFSVSGFGYSQHGRIIGTNCFAQHLCIAGNDIWMLFAGRSVAHGRSMAYNVVGVRPGEGAQQRLAAAQEMTVRLIDEDAPVLNTIRFRKGTLVASDTHLARYLKYVAEFPVARPLDA